MEKLSFKVVTDLSDILATENYNNWKHDFKCSKSFVWTFPMHLYLQAKYKMFAN